MFKDLDKTAAHVAVIKRLERTGIDDYRDRLVERSHNILAPGNIDPDLAPDGRIDLGQQSRRQLHEWYSPHVRCR